MNKERACGEGCKQVKPARIIILVTGCLCLTALGVGIWFYDYSTTPTGTADTTAVVWIRPGQSFFDTLAQLQDAGLVKRPKMFRWLAYLRGLERSVRAGEYELSGSMSPAVILDTLVHGRALLHKVVIPEGSTASGIGYILEKAGLVPREEFLQAAFDSSLARALGVDADSLEGYLYPETYHFPRGVTAQDVIRKMVAQFNSVFSEEWAQRTREIGLTIRQAVTLASIVEREALPAERPLIAAVFLNRLKLGMRLESDPTVIYDIKDFSGNLTRKDMEANTPHNTYQIDGLPPGPIANPGKESIRAVLYPADGPYLYFVSKNDGSHHFSSTLREHNKMVRRYQLKQR